MKNGVLTDVSQITYEACEAINNLEIGGRNYLLNSGDEAVKALTGESAAYDHRGVGQQDRDWQELRSPHSVQSFCGAVHPTDSLSDATTFPSLKNLPLRTDLVVEFTTK